MTSQEKVAYLKGLMAGLELDADKKETKVFAAIVDILDDLAHDLLDVEDDIIELGEQVDAIEEDLSNLEDDVYDDDDEDDDDDDDDDYFLIHCPECDEELYIDSDILETSELKCPKCGNVLVFKASCDCEDCGHHGHNHGEDEDDD